MGLAWAGLLLVGPTTSSAMACTLFPQIGRHPNLGMDRGAMQRCCHPPTCTQCSRKWGETGRPDLQRGAVGRDGSRTADGLDGDHSFHAGPLCPSSSSKTRGKSRIPSIPDLSAAVSKETLEDTGQGLLAAPLFGSSGLTAVDQ